MRDLEDILATAREIAAASRAELARSAVDAPAVRSVARDVEEAHRMAERSKKPVDFPAGPHVGTIYPIGATPRGT